MCRDVHPKKRRKSYPTHSVSRFAWILGDFDKVVRGSSGPPVAAAPCPRGRDFMGALFGEIRIEIEDRTRCGIAGLIIRN